MRHLVLLGSFGISFAGLATALGGPVNYSASEDISGISPFSQGEL
jgi:hypothetical protein